jgi:hypothetical protein
VVASGVTRGYAVIILKKSIFPGVFIKELVQSCGDRLGSYRSALAGTGMTTLDE